jgi:hypothetical protein
VEAEAGTALFTLNPFWVVISGLNVLLMVGFVLLVVWAIRRLRAVGSLQRRVAELEARIAQQERGLPTDR